MPVPVRAERWRLDPHAGATRISRARARGAVEAQKLKKPARAEGYRTEGGRGDERFGGRAADRRQQEQGKQKPGFVDVSVTQMKTGL